MKLFGLFEKLRNLNNCTCRHFYVQMQDLYRGLNFGGRSGWEVIEFVSQLFENIWALFAKGTVWLQKKIRVDARIFLPYQTG